MEISMTALSLAFMRAMIVGACLGVVYDLIRIGRLICGISYGQPGAARLRDVKLPLISKFKEKDRKPKWRKFSKIALDILVFSGDLLFCIFAAFVLVVFIYHANDGMARWMIFFGVAAGFTAYYFSIGRAVMFFSQYIVFAIKSVFFYVVFFVTYPLKLLFSFVFRAIARLWRRIKAGTYTKSEIKKTINASKTGFIG